MSLTFEDVKNDSLFENSPASIRGQVKILSVLQKELEPLKEMLNEVNPEWFVETCKEFTDEDGNVAEICVPIRAAIKLLEKI